MWNTLVWLVCCCVWVLCGWVQDYPFTVFLAFAVLCALEAHKHDQ
jgi:type III secretory pathway component EscV